MYAPLQGTLDARRASLLLFLSRLCLLLLPMALLLMCGVRASGIAPRWLWLGMLFQLLACGFALFDRQGLREPTSVAILTLYGIAFGWMTLHATGREDWFAHLAQALLLVVPLVYCALQNLKESGAPALRRGRQLAKQLRQRRDWPEKLQDCRLLPEVQALREAVHGEAAPALALLADPRPQVCVAALAALEFRQKWRPGQPQVVLQLAQRAVEPEVRAAAINALANVEDRTLVEGVAELLHDPSQLVRQAAAEALLRNTERNWPWIRLVVRRALTDPVCQDDGPLRHQGEPLTAEAVADLTAWTTEKGVQALRAALTLGYHYHRLLSTSSDPVLVERLRRQLADGRTPALLRLELARVLFTHRELEDDLLRKLIHTDNPAPLRLIAVEALLDRGQSAEASAALHELARMPNREIALGIAQVVQRRLGVDLGLPRDQPLPSLHSREAAEVARRVLVWAAHQDVATKVASHSDEADWRSLDELH
jgi:HEAT repeat protein